MKRLVRLKVNGMNHELHTEPWRTLADALRELGFTGVHVGCDQGNCGSCTVIMDGKAVKSCLMLVPQAEGKEVITIEGLARNGVLHPLQQAFIDRFAVQCGFCTSGMILTAKALLDRNPDPTEEEVKAELEGNLCRCTGYVKIVEAVLAAKGNEQSDGQRVRE